MNEQSFESALAQLQEILTELKKDTVDPERAVVLLEKAVPLFNLCNEKVSERILDEQDDED